MKLQRMPILCLLACAPIFAVGQVSVLSQVEAALDSWSGRESTRHAILRTVDDPVPLLATIAQSSRESDVRRSHAIALLATFKVALSQDALVKLADDNLPKNRCLALQSLVELNSDSALPVLIRKLEDQAVCMKVTATDPARERDVYVSDEAVRLLEKITGQSFNRDSDTGHRTTTKWKAWWSKQGRL